MGSTHPNIIAIKLKIISVIKKRQGSVITIRFPSFFFSIASGISRLQQLVEVM
jgi:hypothetical protein